MKIDKKMMDDLFEQRNKISEDLKKVNDVIESLRKVCDHEWKYDGHDSHHDWYKCVVCDESDKDVM
jgi:hypothetical protein